jgi:hypothetical protein
LLLPYYLTNLNETLKEFNKVKDLALKDNKIALVGELLVAAEGEGILDR